MRWQTWQNQKQLILVFGYVKSNTRKKNERIQPINSLSWNTFLNALPQTPPSEGNVIVSVESSDAPEKALLSVSQGGGALGEGRTTSVAVLAVAELLCSGGELWVEGSSWGHGWSTWATWSLCGRLLRNQDGVAASLWNWICRFSLQDSMIRRSNRSEVKYWPVTY